MDVSKTLTDVIQLERGIRDLYADIAASTDNEETAKMLRVLSSESEAHAKQLESRYRTFEKPETIDEGVKSLLSLLSERIAKVKEKVKPAEVLQEGIEIEGYMEQLYKGLADNFKLEAKLAQSLGTGHEEPLKASQVFRQIAADERKHQEILRGL